MKITEKQLRKKIAELLYDYKYSDDIPLAESVADNIIAEIKKAINWRQRMKSKKEIKEALKIADKLREIIEDSFNKVPVSKDTPRVFEFECKKCKERVGRIEKLEHLQRKHNLPYFITGREALEWVLKKH